MVRVSGVATSRATRTPNATARLLAVAAVPSAIPSCCHRRPHPDEYLPHRSKLGRARRASRPVYFVFMTLTMLAVFGILQRYLLSFMVIDETIYGNDNPLWKHCPANAAPDRVESGGEDICFLTCIFGDNIGDVDRPANVEWFDNYWCHTRFLLVTNLPGLPAPGWTKIVANTTKDSIGHNIAQNQMTNDVTQKQHIVRSRHAKFLAWEALPEIAPKHCASVVYMDGYLIPVRYTSWWTLLSALVGTPPWSPASPLFLGSFPWNRNNQIPPPAKFQTVVRQVKSHPWGLSQVKQKYFDGLPMTTLLNNLVRDRKDTREHVETTLEWFRTQTTDFQEIMPYYLNKYFAYDPNNARYRELSSSFWKTYTTYGGLWRDQPLWAYFLYHFNVTPAVMTTKGTITKGGDLFQTGGKLGWGKHIYT